MKTVVAVAAVALMTACAVRRSEPIGRPLPLATETLQRGERLYMRHCNQCHYQGEFGFGPALNNKPAPKFLMRIQVRAGLGAMPRFSKTDIPPDDLNAILDYVVARRTHR